MSIVDIKWHPSKRELRKFGGVVIIGMSIIGLVFQFLFDLGDVAKIIYIVGATIGLPGLTGTKIALPGYWIWMGIGFILGNIMGRILLAAIYFLVLFPISVGRHIFGKKRISLKITETDSYWSDLESTNEAARYQRQF